MQRSTSLLFWTLGGLALSGLGVCRAAELRTTARIERDLQDVPAPPVPFAEGLIAGLPEPARRYLRHAIMPGTPLAPAARLHMEGTMKPNPGGSPVDLTAEETLAPRRGFVWSARARMFGMPVHIHDHYVASDGGVRVSLFGLTPLPLGRGPEVARSARGRLVAEAVWCPTALVGPSVAWEAAGPDRARYALTVDGERIPVTIRVGPNGAIREVTLDRWGDVGVPTWQAIPYGFRVEEEQAFDGVTIPTRLRGGWWYGTDRFDDDTAATFMVTDACFATE